MEGETYWAGSVSEANNRDSSMASSSLGGIRLIVWSERNRDALFNVFVRIRQKSRICQSRSKSYKQRNTYPSLKSLVAPDTRLSSPLPMGAAAAPGLAPEVEGAEPSFVADLHLYQ